MAYKLTGKYTLYSITNTITNKIYIGVTEVFERRIAQHKVKLRKNIHRSVSMQSDYNDFGLDSFVFDVICIFENKIEAHRVEKYYTDYILGMNKEICYNVYNGGIPYFNFGTNIKPSKEAIINSLATRKGRPVSEETRQKRSVSMKGRTFSEETKKLFSEKCHFSRKVIDTNTGHIYNSLTEANSLYPDVKYGTLCAWLTKPNRLNKSSLKWL